MSQSRERIVTELMCIIIKNTNGEKCMEAIADFIIADRKRVVEALVKLNPDRESWTLLGCMEAIDETLKNAGVSL